MFDLGPKNECTVCKFIYDPAIGDPDYVIKAGKAFKDIPDDWQCPFAKLQRKTLEK